jgi:hypothetical protein
VREEPSRARDPQAKDAPGVEQESGGAPGSSDREEGL